MKYLLYLYAFGFGMFGYIAVATFLKQDYLWSLIWFGFFLMSIGGAFSHWKKHK